MLVKRLPLALLCAVLSFLYTSVGAQVIEPCEVVPVTGLTCQVNPDGTFVVVSWINNDNDDYVELIVRLDGEDVETLDPDVEEFDITDIDPGRHLVEVFAVGADCEVPSEPCFVLFDTFEACIELPQNLFPDFTNPSATVHEVLLSGPAGTDEITIAEIDATVHMLTDRAGDWNIDVTSPAGTLVTLHEGPVYPPVNGDWNVIFAQYGMPLVAPFDCGCPVQPTGPGTLLDFAGELSSGDWALSFADNDFGELLDACIAFYPQCPVEPPTECDLILEDGLLELFWTNSQEYSEVQIEIVSLSLTSMEPILVQVDPEAESFSYLPEQPGEFQFNIRATTEEDDCWSTECSITSFVDGLPAGADLFETEFLEYSFCDDPIPAGFFYPGCLPFESFIEFHGVPLETAGAFELGTTDTVIQRVGPILYPPEPVAGGTNQHSVQIEMVALSLTSSAPIVVSYGDGTQEWDVQVTLSDEPADSLGTMTIEREESDELGNFEMQDLLSPVLMTFSSSQFIRCDANLDLRVDIADLIKILEIAFLDGETDCPDSADANDDGLIDLLDFFTGSDYLFGGGPQPAAPFPTAGDDETTDDELGCLQTRVLAGRQLTYAGSGQWNRDDDCSGADLRVPRLPMGFCMDELEIDGVCLTGSLVSPSEDVDRPQADIDPDAEVSPDVASIGRDAVISAGAVIGAGVVIGPGAFIGENAVIGDNVLIAQDSVVGDETSVGENTVVSGEVSIGAECMIGQNVVILDGTELADNCTVGDGSHFSVDSFFDVYTEVSIGCSVGANVTCGEEVFLASGVNIPSGAIVADFEEILDDLQRCSVLLDNGTDVGTAEDCEDADGAVLGNIPAGQLNTPGEKKSEDKIDTTDLPEELEDLADDASRATSPGNDTKIKDRKWTKDTYDCDDFAHDLERALQDDGDDSDDEPDDYDSTFTVFWRWQLVWSYDWHNRRWVRKWDNYYAHAVTDIHTDDGILFIEPQNGKFIDLDFDGDGKVEYETTHGTKFTEGQTRIEVYDDRAAAEKAGVKMD